MLEVRDFIHKTVHGGRVVALNRIFVSSSFNQIVNILEKHLGKEQEISTLFNKYFNQINNLKSNFTKKYEFRFSDYRQINPKELDNYVNKKLSNIPISIELNKINKSDVFVSSDYCSLYPSAMSHDDSTWPAIETAKAISVDNSDQLCELFNKGEWKNINKTGFFKVK